MRWVVHGRTTPVTSQCSSSPNSVCRQKTSPGPDFTGVHVALFMFTDRPSFVAVRSPPTETAGKTKNPAYVSVSRVRESRFRFFTCLRRVHPNYPWAAAQRVPRIVPGETHNPGYTGYDVSLSRPPWSANSWLICSCKFSSNVPDV